MFKNYIKLALRNLWKNKIFSGINIIGLSIGLAVCITIMLFVQYEKSFDSFHTKNIYRLDEVQSWEGMVQPQKVALSMYPMASTLKNDFPEVITATHFHFNPATSVKYNDTKIFFKRSYWADSNFFKIFDFKLAKGDRKTALREPKSIVLTNESAEKLFGKEDPLGKTLSTNNSRDTIQFIVTGVLEPLPKNSHLQFEVLYSFNSFVGPETLNEWGGNWTITYLELSPNANIKALEKKFPAYLQKYMGKDATKGYKLFLQSLPEVHGHSGDITHDYNNFQKFDSDYTQVFFIIAIIVLLIGCINFINLSTARSSGRAKEVGVRKSIGAHRSQLAFQFIGESVLLSLIAMILAIVLVKLFLPYINNLSGHELEFSVFTNPVLLLKVIAGTTLIGIISGIYPALYLSAFKPVQVLKGTLLSGNNKSFTRNALVVSQFAGAAFLIIATIFVVKQLNFMQNRDTGFSRDQIVMLPGAYKNWYRLKDELSKNTLIKSVSGSTQRLGNNLHQTGVAFYGDGPVKELATSHVLVDHDFLSIYEIKLSAGKNFTREGEGHEIIINETMAKELLKDSPNATIESLIGKRMQMDEDSTTTLVGVCKDFNFNSLHHKIETLCLYNKKQGGYSDVCVKIDGARTEEALAYTKSVWEKIIPNYPYEYQFLDDHFAQMYEADKKVSKVVSILAALAILIACMGLLGLASYSTEKRVKEIGIRKVLGASVLNVVSLLSKDFIKLVIVANIIAWPLGWWVVSKWLQDFAYRIDMSWWIFALAGLSSLLIALLTVSTQTLKAAKNNPVKNLRIE
ncbi:MAG: ABC transporter permease [Bacteroidia bacterium]